MKRFKVKFYPNDEQRDAALISAIKSHKEGIEVYYRPFSSCEKFCECEFVGMDKMEWHGEMEGIWVNVAGKGLTILVSCNLSDSTDEIDSEEEIKKEYRVDTMLEGIQTVIDNPMLGLE